MNFEAANNNWVLVVVIRFFLEESQPTVAAGVIARRIEVDEDFRVAERAAAAVAGDKSVGHWSGRNLVHQFNGPARVHLSLGSEIGRWEFRSWKQVPSWQHKPFSSCQQIEPDGSRSSQTPIKFTSVLVSIHNDPCHYHHHHLQLTWPVWVSMSWNSSLFETAVVEAPGAELPLLVEALARLARATRDTCFKHCNRLIILVEANCWRRCRSWSPPKVAKEEDAAHKQSKQTFTLWTFFKTIYT